MSDLAAIVSTLLSDLEAADPVDFGDMPANDDETRRLVVTSLVKFHESLAQQGVPAQSREALALATAARLVLENMVLHYRLLKATGASVQSAQEILDRFRLGRS